MTGHGRAQRADNGLRFTVEMHSVNRRHLDVALNLPRELSALEPRIREAATAALARGRLNVTVNFDSTGNARQQVAVDAKLAEEYHRTAQRLQKRLKLGGEIDINTILRAPGVLRTVDERISPDKAWRSLKPAISEALEVLVRMREKEGRHLARDIRARLKIVSQASRQIRRLYPRAVERYRASLRERIEKAGLPIPADDERLVKEAFLYAERSDISEELTRLDSHMEQFQEHLGKTEPVGRTLEFITQEILRELNTLGAKANDAKVSQEVVRCKSEMEKIREQVQNIE